MLRECRVNHDINEPTYFFVAKARDGLIAAMELKDCRASIDKLEGAGMTSYTGAAPLITGLHVLLLL